MSKATKAKKQLINLPPRLESELADSKLVSINSSEHFYIHHSVNIGDLWAAMGAIKKIYELTGKKVVVYQSIDRKAQYYAGATHPTLNERGENVSMNLAMWNMVKPLVEHQDYIAYAEIYSGQHIDVDFEVIRTKTFVNLPNGAIQQWIPLAFPDLQFDLTKAWMYIKGDCPTHIKKQVENKIIINFTERYRNDGIKYFFLKEFQKDLIFSGTKNEHQLFCEKWDLEIPLIEVNDFLELAHAITVCRFIMANQSMLWNMAEAIKVPRILEICSYAANCQIMIGEDSLGYLHQVGAEFSFKTLYEKSPK